MLTCVKQLVWQDLIIFKQNPPLQNEIQSTGASRPDPEQRPGVVAEVFSLFYNYLVTTPFMLFSFLILNCCDNLIKQITGTQCASGQVI